MFISERLALSECFALSKARAYGIFTSRRLDNRFARIVPLSAPSARRTTQSVNQAADHPVNPLPLVDPLPEHLHAQDESIERSFDDLIEQPSHHVRLALESIPASLAADYG